MTIMTIPRSEKNATEWQPPTASLIRLAVHIDSPHHWSDQCTWQDQGYGHLTWTYAWSTRNRQWPGTGCVQPTQLPDEFGTTVGRQRSSNTIGCTPLPLKLLPTWSSLACWYTCHGGDARCVGVPSRHLLRSSTASAGSLPGFLLVRQSEKDHNRYHEHQPLVTVLPTSTAVSKRAALCSVHHL